MLEPNDFSRANPFFNMEKAEREAKWRAFLAWQLVWNNALVVSMFGASMVPWGNGEHALALITYASLNPAAIDELYTRHLDVADYWESWT